MMWKAGMASVFEAEVEEDLVSGESILRTSIKEPGPRNDIKFLVRKSQETRLIVERRMKVRSSTWKQKNELTAMNKQQRDRFLNFTPLMQEMDV